MPKSLRVSQEKDIDAYNFPPESDYTADFSESEYGEDSTISREWTLSPTSISALEDNDIYTTTQIDASKLEDEAELEDDVVRCKPELWTEYPAIKDFDVCTIPLQQSASDVDNQASSPEPRLLSPVRHSYSESDDGLNNDEPLEKKNPEPLKLSPVYQSSSESEADLKDDEPLEANNPEPRPSYPVYQSFKESNDDLKDDKSLEGNNPEPRPISRVHQYHPESDDDQRDDELLKIKITEPRPFFNVHKSHPESDDYQKDDEPLEAESPESRLFSRVHTSRPESDDDQKDDQPLEEESPEPRQLFSAHQFYSECDYCHWDNESPEADSPEPRQLFPVHLFHPAGYDPKPAQMEVLCPEPTRRYPTHKVILEPELFEDWFVDMSEPIFIDEEENSPESSILATPNPAYDPKFAQMEILCPEPTRKYPTHKVILEPELFEDWFVDISEPIFIDEEETSPEPSILETPSPEPQTPSPVRCYTPNPEFRDHESRKAHSPEPQRFVPVHQFHPRLYEPQPILELDYEGLESLEIWNIYH